MLKKQKQINETRASGKKITINFRAKINVIETKIKKIQKFNEKRIGSLKQ